jgi:DNA-binding protein YbaB
MLDQIKKIQELKRLQDSFKKEKEVVEKEGTSVEMNGNFEVLNINLNLDLDKNRQEEILRNCLNEARENIQKRLAKMMMSSGINF